MDAEYSLILQHTKGVGGGKVKKWLQEGHALKQKATTFSKNSANWQGIKKDLAWLGARDNRYIIGQDSPQYPKLLQEISCPPILLYVEGLIDCLQGSQVAIVGSRNPSQSGKLLAKKFAYQLSMLGFYVTSGMALGVDGCAHVGALEAERGKTIAVLGSGLNYIYPYKHRVLAEKIIEKGALISEFPIDTPPQGYNFPRRNRIISGLSAGVLVVEATLKSGSLTTAQFAVEQGREIFAVPGSLFGGNSKGCHYLIRQGAKLVENVSDITEEIKEITRFVTSKENMPKVKDQSSKISRMAHDIIEKMGGNVMPLEAIIAHSGLTMAKVSAMLLQLELGGYITSVPGGYIKNMGD